MFILIHLIGFKYKKIQRYDFLDLFVQQIYSTHDLGISCTTSRGKIFQNRHVFHDKKIEKRCLKNQIWNH